MGKIILYKGIETVAKTVHNKRKWETKMRIMKKTSMKNQLKLTEIHHPNRTKISLPPKKGKPLPTCPNAKF